MTIVFKRQLAELKILSYIFLAVIITFICLMFTELMTDKVAVADTLNMDELTRTKGDYHLITAIAILVFAFQVQFMIFPTYSELEKRSTARFTQVSMIYTSIVTTSYTTVAIIGMLLFGSEISSDLLTNISQRTGTVSIWMRVSYCFLLLLHLPYFFFSVKEYTLVIIDELLNRSLSTHLEQKLTDFYKKRDEEREVGAKQSRTARETRKQEPDHPEVVKAPETPATPIIKDNPFEAIETDNLLEKSDQITKQLYETDKNSEGRRDTMGSELSACSAKSALTYKSLSDNYFFWTALILHIMILSLALTIQSIEILFEFAGAISCGSAMFLFPGVAYILALRKYGKPSHRELWSTFFYHSLAWVYIALFVALISAFTYL